jgi:hypothetical protein
MRRGGTSQQWEGRTGARVILPIVPLLVKPFLSPEKLD